MNDPLSLKQQAISAAKNNDWELVATLNEEIITNNPQDLQALNRLGVAYLQLGKAQKAKVVFETVIGLDKTNILAKKHLATIKQKKTVAVPSFSAQQFIEEPGKTKIVELHRLSGKEILESLITGQICDLKIKKRFISIETDGKYVGSLPEDISFRLSKLIQAGNLYHCAIHSANTKNCSVYLKEKFSSKKNSDVLSFPVQRTSLNTNSEMDDFVLLDEELPVEILNHDSDVEKTLDDIKQPDSGMSYSNSNDS
ncbi:MAG: hypothetical protein COY80_03920 [Candidatus Pacebacteria bacterium CG_4_10_14_0_8_um_filter_42_14]|nr:MAG: hypothetical protein COY80_03920 [Candidatus Pacebacteria bacterium CG_4_10_14_0_8_um_filter_42_14]